jgi:aspartyl-tRNA(Asn)/glutamyl-tRNA(Gln) amidotransferase subunit A
LTIAYCPDWGDIRVDRRVRSLVDRAVARFETDLACIVTIEMAPFGDFIDSFRALVALETDIVGTRALCARREDDLSPSLRALLSKSWTAEAFTDAITARKKAAQAMAEFMRRFDLLLTPTVPIPPFAIDMAGPGMIESDTVDDDAWTPALYPANLTGQPAASVPAWWTEDGLPVGLQIMGRHLADRAVVAAAAAFEACQPWIGKRPIVSY